MKDVATLDRPQVAGLDKARVFAASRHQLFIDGRWVEPQEGRRFVTHDPATGAQLAEIAEAREADVDLAVAAARRAMEGSEWGNMKPAARARLLNRLADALEANADELAALETLDNGKIGRAHV